VLSGEIAPTKVLATPGMMGAVQSKLARFLGPKGLMPVAKRGGVGEGDELAQRIKEAGGLMEWKADKLGVVRARE
jgi:large subunit ribosomal protein L1